MESLERLKKEEGSGCILAHCMGLGKTLSVILCLYIHMFDIESSWFSDNGAVYFTYNFLVAVYYLLGGSAVCINRKSSA